jgi:hypothetical protein
MGHCMLYPHCCLPLPCLPKLLIYIWQLCPTAYLAVDSSLLIQEWEITFIITL